MGSDQLSAVSLQLRIAVAFAAVSSSLNAERFLGVPAMIVVSNRIPVAVGHEAAFEERFRGRAGLVEHHQGFVRMEILRPKQVEMHGKPLGGSSYYVVLTYWEGEADFVRWTDSEDFRRAHASRPPKEMFAGPNVFEMHEVIQTAPDSVR
jgi:heme oxygenase (mycobilin-producing)